MIALNSRKNARSLFSLASRPTGARDPRAGRSRGRARRSWATCGGDPPFSAFLHPFVNQRPRHARARPWLRRCYSLGTARYSFFRTVPRCTSAKPPPMHPSGAVRTKRPLATARRSTRVRCARTFCRPLCDPRLANTPLARARPSRHLLVTSYSYKLSCIKKGVCLFSTVSSPPYTYRRRLGGGCESPLPGGVWPEENLKQKTPKVREGRSQSVTL